MTVTGPVFPEPVEIIAVDPIGESFKIFGIGKRTNQAYRQILSAAQVAMLESTPEEMPYDGDAGRFRLGVEAMRLGLAHEYDPYFSLSIARVDPLPHQLEAVYEYFLKLPRIRFLLADDPGAGKTIMAGLLIKELKIRGLAKRILILTPASLSFQWQRELKEKFRENFEVINGNVLRTNYGSNPWQEKDQVVTSVAWVSVIDDARESLLRSHWDLIIVDEAHKMSAYNADKKTLAYQLGEKLSEMTDHYLLMTATPHKGDPENFSLFLRLLDPDVYGDIKSLHYAMEQKEAPFYLRRVKEALKTFPDPVTGVVKLLFTKRLVRTLEFQIDAEELDLYDDLTQYVEDQSIKAAGDETPRGRALGFTMAMLQRRFSSSIYAVRKSLERMQRRREEILKDPDKHRREQIAKRLPENFDDLPEEERQERMTDAENVVASVNPADLREEIATLRRLVAKAGTLEEREVESKLAKLKALLTSEGIFADRKLKLLIFTEHKDTLDFLVGDGEGGRPLGKLREWGLTVTQIHGGMKIGDRDTPGTRIYAEREFRENCQVLVATEAAGEGINLQFCWMMINFDIPWNPMRLEQRMGRIHRYGQERDCLIFNFVSTNTREGRVLHKLFERVQTIEEALDPEHTGKVFNVLGDVFPANELERLIRQMYERNMSVERITDRIVQEVDIEHFRRITNSTLEGLAKRELNLTAIVGKNEEAKARRLVPEVIEDFFLKAASLSGITPKPTRIERAYSIGKVPRLLTQIGDRLEPRYGRIGREYKTITFDKKLLERDATLEWVTPGHPLFECVRHDVKERAGEDLQRGAIFYNLHQSTPSRLDLFRSSVKDGMGNVIHQRLYVVETDAAGVMIIRQPTIFLDLIPAPEKTVAPVIDGLPGHAEAEHFLSKHLLGTFLEEVRETRQREVNTIRKHLDLSLMTLIDRQSIRLAQLHEQLEAGSDNVNLVHANIATTNERLEDLNHRRDRRLRELEGELQVSVADTVRLGSAWALPHPDRNAPELAPMKSDAEIERRAVEAAMTYERERGWVPQSVESENLGYDLISRRFGLNDPETPVEWRYIEVKGRAGIGAVALTENEYMTARRLGADYWLYVAFNCATEPELRMIQNPALELEWQTVVKVEHYLVGAASILLNS